MSTKKLFFAVCLSIHCLLSASGQETMVLKDGSRLYGLTWKEDYTDMSKTFSFDSVSLVVPKSALSNIEPDKRALTYLNSEMRRYFEHHPEKIVYHNNEPYVYLASGFNVEKGKRNNLNLSGYVIIEEVSDSTARVFWPSIGMMTVDWKKDVDHVVTAPRNPLALVGTIDVLETKQGVRLVGQIVDTDHKGTTILTDNGVRHKISKDNIRAKRIQPFNPNRPLKEQISHRYRLEGGKGTQPTYGFITETVYSSQNQEGYYMVSDLEGLNKTKLLFSEVDKITREANPDFVKELDVNVAPDEFLIQGISAKPVTYEVKTDRYEVKDTSNVVKVKAAALKDNNLKVHFRSLPAHSEFFFVEARETPKSAEEAKRSGKNKEKDTPEKTPFYATLHDVIQSLPPTDRFVSPIGNVSMNFGPVTAGKSYFIIRKGAPEKTAYMVLIEP